MKRILDRLLGRAEAPAAPQDPVAAALRSSFLAMLDHYPPREWPHVGLPSALSDAQVDENHAWFLRTRQERLDGLLSLLADAGVDATALLDAQADPAPAVRDLRHWLERCLPERAQLPGGQQPHAPDRDYLGHAHLGARIFYAFVGDLATLYGEAIVRRRSEFTWGVDRFRDSVGMAHHRRTVVSRPPTGGWSATVLDLELDTLARLYAMRGGGPGVQPNLGGVVLDVISGAMDPR